MLGIVLILGVPIKLFKGLTGQKFWQKTCRKLDSGSAESCESGYHQGFCCFSNIRSILTHCLVPMADIWIKHKVVSSNTYSLIQFGETCGKNTLSLPFFAVGLWERTCEKNKINSSHFILAISTPIKCKEKLKSGQQERWTVTRMMSDGRGVPRAHRWLFSQPWFSIQNGDFISGRVWKQACSFPK